MSRKLLELGTGVDMRQVLRGNFEPQRPPRIGDAAEEDLTTRFEAEALRRLGGSIAFVSKKKFTLGLEVAADKSKGGSDPGAPEAS